MELEVCRDQQKVKKVVDKDWQLWYIKQAVAEADKQSTLTNKQYIPTLKILKTEEAEASG
ncbi:MAG: hypothetical protein LUE63_00090 [Lachnospiraceae bacterium]|nr:hypothetical protein [Lachnospiraceae bacterium]